MFDEKMEILRKDLEQLKTNIEIFGEKVQFLGGVQQKSDWEKLVDHLKVTQNLYDEYFLATEKETASALKRDLETKLTDLQNQYLTIRSEMEK